MERVAVIDYGGSNLRSVVKAIEHVAAKNIQVEVSDDPALITRADRVVFPGQGAIGDCMQRLTERALIETVKTSIKERPFLGICLGLQSLMATSDEDGGTDCLACYPGSVKRFTTPAPPDEDGRPQKIPHMGWNRVAWNRPHALTEGIETGTRFYFVHSYYVVPQDAALAIGETRYIGPLRLGPGPRQRFCGAVSPREKRRPGAAITREFSRLARLSPYRGRSVIRRLNLARDRTITDIAAIKCAVPVDLGGTRVGALLGLGNGSAKPDHTQDPATTVDDRRIFKRGTGVKNVGVGEAVFETGNRVPGIARGRVTARGHHDPKRRALVPFELDLCGVTVEHRVASSDEVGIQAHHNWLSFRVTKAAIELEYLGHAVGRDHQARHIKTRDSAFRHGADRTKSVSITVSIIRSWVAGSTIGAGL